MSSYWNFANDLETRVFFVVAALPLGWKVIFDEAAGCNWEQPCFYLVSIVAVWLTNRCFTPPRIGGDVELSKTSNDTTSGSSTARAVSSGSVARTSKPSKSIESIGNGPFIDKKESGNGKAEDKVEDAILFASSSLFLWSSKLFVYITGLYHSILTLYLPMSPTSTDELDTFNRLCPNPGALNTSLFRFTALSSLTLALIIVSSLFRLLAFHQLGQNFTFDLRRPKGLIKTGLYAWLQHPSYTFLFTLLIANTFLFHRLDASYACVIGGGNGWLAWVDQESWWWKSVTLVRAGIALLGAFKRIKEEETVLRNEFGEEWEVWHRTTRRLIPGVF